MANVTKTIAVNTQSEIDLVEHTVRYKQVTPPAVISGSQILTTTQESNILNINISVPDEFTGALFDIDITSNFTFKNVNTSTTVNVGKEVAK